MALLKSVFPTVLNDIIVRVLFVVVILLHFAGWLERDAFLLTFCLIYVAQALLLAAYVLVVDRPSLVPDIAHLRQEIGLRSIMRYGAVITFASINSVSLKFIDSIFVGRISTEQVAVYSIAAFIGLIIEIPLTALERIANPAIGHALAKNDLGQVRTIYHRSARFLFLLGGLCFVLVVGNVVDVLGELPEGYQAGASVTMVIALGALINMATGINYPILVNSDRYIYGSVFLVILLVVTVIGNWLLIPRMGMMGAAVTACGASVIYNALKYEFIRRRFGMQPFDGTTVRIAGVVLLLAAVAWSVPLPWGAYGNVAVRTVIGVGAYVLLVRQLGLALDALEHIPPALRRWFERVPARP
jgi:O-antigen/teichoic acid export membrane protein